MTGDGPPQVLGLRAGDWVEVRSKEEILRTLDARGMLDNLPFMPEMLAWCGQRLRVAKAAHKTCDTISGAYEGRRMTNAVHLEDLRCDGKAHGGCEAACLIYWKEAWLKRADAVSDGAPPAASTASKAGGGGCTEAQLTAATLGSATFDKPGPGPALAGPSYVCQATEVLRFTTCASTSPTTAPATWACDASPTARPMRWRPSWSACRRPAHACRTRS